MGSSDYLLIAGLVMIALWCVFGILVYRYRPKGTIRDAPRGGIAAITVVAVALMILFAALSFLDGEIGEEDVRKLKLFGKNEVGPNDDKRFVVTHVGNRFGKSGGVSFPASFHENASAILSESG